MMTSKELVLAALNHQPTARVPFAWGCGVNGQVRAELAKEMGHASPAETEAYLQSLMDFRWVSPRYIGPADRNCTVDGVETDIWGVKRRFSSYGLGGYMEICEYPLAEMETVEDLENFTWPSVDWFDFSVLPAQIKSHNQNGNEYAIIMGNGNILESSWYMRGLELMLTDLLVEPELAEAVMTRVTNFFIEYFTRALTVTNRGGTPIDVIMTADDIGTQEGLMVSLDLWERMIKPHHMRLNEALHRFGVKILYHTDGAVMDALDGLVDMGIDVLEALQFDAKNMSPEIMKEKYGDRLCFQGGISVQSTLPFGTPDEVRREIEERIRVLGAGGGYILAPSHAIQDGTPIENVKVLLGYGRR